jgi:hypothetical protein
VAVDRAAGEPGEPSGPVGWLERAQRRAWGAERRAHRPGRPGTPGSRCWLTFRRTRFSGHVPLAVVGGWCGVHKPTILRWVVKRAPALRPRIAQWMGERSQGAYRWLGRQLQVRKQVPPGLSTDG